MNQECMDNLMIILGFDQINLAKHFVKSRGSDNHTAAFFCAVVQTKPESSAFHDQHDLSS